MDTPQFSEPDAKDIESLLQFAVLAPSSHNTQPWYFKIDGRRISLFADRTRALPANDPDDRELTISCGCALMNLRAAAARAGMATEVRLFPDTNDRDLLATVNLVAGQPDAVDAALFPAVVGRRTYRKRFESKSVPNEILEELSKSASEEGVWLRVLNTHAQRDEVASLISEGDSIQWANASWRRELAAWMHPRRKGEGLTVPGLVAPIAQIVVRTFDMGNGVGAKDKQLATESPVLGVFGTDLDGTDDWIKAGQALERVLLDAHLKGLQASYLNQPVQVVSLRPKLQHLVGHSGFPQILFRLGYPMEVLPASPRRGLDEVVD